VEERVNRVLLTLLCLALVSLEVLGGGVPLTFALPAYALLAVAAIASAARWQHRRKEIDPICGISACLFFGYVIVRILVSPVEYLARGDLYLALAAVVVYAMVAFYITEPRLRLLLVASLLGLGILHTALGLVQAFASDATPWLQHLRGYYGTRASGFYVCPNHLAGFLEVVILFGLSIVVWSRCRYLVKVLTAYACLACLAGLVLTGSRGGYLSLMAGLIVFGVLSLWTHGKRVSFMRWPLAVACLLLIVSVAAGISFVGQQHLPLSERWGRLFETHDVRITLWRGAVMQFGLSPVAGTGAGTYLYYGRLFRPSEISADPVVAHNDFLQFLGEFGALGMTLLAIFLFTQVRHGWRNLRWLREERLADQARLRSDTLAIHIGALSTLAAYMVHSALDFNLHIPANALLLAAVMGMLATQTRATVSESPPRRWIVLALPALGIWMALAFIPTAPAEYYCHRARLAAARGDYPTALALAKTAAASDPRNPQIYRYMGEAQLALGYEAAHAERAPSFRAAADSLRKAVDLFPQDRDLLAMLGEALDELGHFDEAEQIFARALAWDPNSHQMRFYYGRHLAKAGKKDLAVASYQQSLRLYWNWAAHWGLEELKK
jgi:O-antigen ligase